MKKVLAFFEVCLLAISQFFGTPMIHGELPTYAKIYEVLHFEACEHASRIDVTLTKKNNLMSIEELDVHVLTC